jgi:uncharacterized damage-inducible protein DinB
MNTAEHLRQLFAYNAWADRRVMAALAAGESEKARRILAHSLVTAKEYFERLGGKDSTGFDFWPELSLAECAELATEIEAAYENLLRDAEEKDLNLRAKYKTSAGAPFENDFRELLAHVLLHAATHRGNIILKLREEGFTPPKIDYIIYLRELEREP